MSVKLVLISLPNKFSSNVKIGKISLSIEYDSESKFLKIFVSNL